MSPGAQRIAIAEACGWKWYPKFHCWADAENAAGEPHAGSNRALYEYELPADLNAMHEAEKVLTPEQTEIYMGILDDVLEIPMAFYGTARRAFLVAHAAAGQRAESFLRATNLWTT